MGKATITRNVTFLRRGEKGDPGAKGEKGAVIRTSRWEDVPDGFQFQSGANGEQFIDVVLYKHGRMDIYKCKKSHSKDANEVPAPNQYWVLGDIVSLLATDIALIDNAIIANWLFNNGQLESQQKDGEGNPNIYLNGLLGTAKLGWLIINDEKLKGYDADGKERLLITPDNIPSISNIGGQQESDIKITGADVQGAGAYSINGNSCRMFAEAYIACNANTGQHTPPVPASFTCSFSFNSSGDKIHFSLRARCEMKFLYAHETVPKFQGSQIIVTSSDVSLSEADTGTNYHDYSADETFSGAGSHTVSLTFSCQNLPANLASHEYYYDMIIEVTNLTEKIYPSRTIIGKDGFLSTYEGNYIEFKVDEGFEVKIGSYGLKIDSSGIKKNTGNGWTNL